VYNIQLHDSYGDGWNSASVSVSVNGVTTLDRLTLTNGYTQAKSDFICKDGDSVIIQYAQGKTHDDENSYVLSRQTIQYQEQDPVVYHSTLPPPISYSFVAKCDIDRTNHFWASGPGLSLNPKPTEEVVESKPYDNLDLGEKWATSFGALADADQLNHMASNTLSGVESAITSLCSGPPCG